jgi:acyl carrier protein
VARAVSPHDDLITAFATWSPALAQDIARDTPLLTSGRLDSMAVFQLLLWIEARVGHAIDVTAIDMPAQWNTVDAIVAFVEREHRP